MLFRRCAQITADDIETAKQRVLQQSGHGESIDFLVQWQPWRQALERAHPDEYERVREFNQPEREAIACQPPRMNEQQWKEAFDRQAANEASQMISTSRRLTRAFMEVHELEWLCRVDPMRFASGAIGPAPDLDCADAVDPSYPVWGKPST